MSASHRERDMFIAVPFRLNIMENAIVCHQFEAQVDHDVLEIEQTIRDEKYLRKVCWFRTFCFLFEVPLTILILGKDALKDRLITQVLYNQYILKKINLEQFKEQFNRLSHTG